jgi:accessory gene regulator protein AgrB
MIYNHCSTTNEWKKIENGRALRNDKKPEFIYLNCLLLLRVACILILSTELISSILLLGIEIWPCTYRVEYSRTPNLFHHKGKERKRNASSLSEH